MTGDTTSKDFFEAKYKACGDPWEFATNNYEQQRYAAVIAEFDDLDVEAMKVLIRAQHEQLSSRAREIAHLKRLLDKLQQMLLGAKSENLVSQVAHMELQLEELETSRGEEEVSLPLPLRELVEPKPRASSRSLPEYLPREVKTHRPETSCCPGCGGTLREFGEDVSEVLEYVPRASRSSAVYGRSSAAGVGRRRSKQRPFRGRSAPMPGPGCSRMCWWRSFATTNR